MLSKQGKRAVFYLLQQVGNSIRMMDIHIAFFLVDGGLISFQAKSLPDLDQSLHDVIVSLSPDVEVTCIEPAADVQSRNMLAGLVRRIGCGALGIQIKMLVIYRSL